MAEMCFQSGSCEKGDQGVNSNNLALGTKTKPADERVFDLAIGAGQETRH
jgi:hypothetical protein